MSQSLSSKRLTHLALETQTNAECARIVRLDGTTIGLTNHVEDISLGGVTYLTGAAYTPTAHSANIQYEPGVVDVEGILAIAGVARADIEAGLFDFASVYIFQTDYTDPVVDEHPLFAGRWGKVEIREGRYLTQFHSLKDHLAQPIGRTYTPSCTATFGDANCGVRLDATTWAATTAYTVREDQDAATGSLVKPSSENGRFFKCTTAGTSGASEPSWDTTIGAETTDGTVTWEAIQATTLTGTVTGATGANVFIDTSRTEQDGFWTYGKVTWTGGDNSGLSMEIKAFTYVNGSPGDPEFTLFLPLPNDIQVGDTYTVQAGCRKRFDEDCIAKYDNADNFRGFPHIPTTDQAGKFGGQ